jgi:anti-sigma-K factor RskA
MIDTLDQELAALYALDLLEAGRRAEFERALGAQPDLRRLVRDFQQVTDELALDCPGQTAPAGAWERIRLQVHWAQERDRSSRHLRRRTRWAIAGWAVAACLAAGWCLSLFLRTPTPAGGEASKDLARSSPSPARLGLTQGSSPHDASTTSISNKVTRPAVATDRTNALQAQLNAARVRERQWSDAFAAALGQITNLTIQLEARGTSGPGLRRVSWVALSPPGQAQLADQALDAILSQLPLVLTNVMTPTPSPADGNSPKLGGMRFEPLESSPANQRLPDGNQPANTERETETVGNSPEPTLRQSIQPSETVGIAVWDGRSPTMVAAFSGVTAPPEGHQWVVWSAGQGGEDVALGTLYAPGSANAGVVQIPVPNSAWAAGSPNLIITLEATGSALSFPTGPVLIRTP